MMTKLEKKEGVVEQCPTCHNKITCRMTKGSEKYPAKLQWQNDDGTAHYSFDFATKTTTCKGTAEKVQSVSTEVKKMGEIHLDKIDLSLEQLDHLRIETDTMLKWQLARIYYIREGLKNRGITPYEPFVGMLYNQQMASLREESRQETEFLTS